MRTRTPIRCALIHGTVVIALMVIAGCGSSEPVAETHAVHADFDPAEPVRRGMRAVGEARRVEEVLNDRQVRATLDLDR